jgi:microcystin-dependent protein
MASTPMLGAIYMFGGNFEPRGYAFCHGQLLGISQNAALFSLLGTTYGGDGIQTFALPDLQGRAPIGTGTGAGLPTVIEGEKAGVQSVTILTSNMPAHNHLINASSQPAAAGAPSAAFLANSGTGLTGGLPVYITGVTPDSQLASQSVSVAGGSIPLDIQTPYLGVNFIIALAGFFPSRG